jgi:hypothetical protein
MDIQNQFQGNYYKRNIKRPTKVFHAGHNIPLAIYIHEFLKKLDPFPATEIQILLILSKW